jgi:NAD(P)-dependent dehydrogenase (short-subunit alcohol dehydrogenase family)
VRNFQALTKIQFQAFAARHNQCTIRRAQGRQKHRRLDGLYKQNLVPITRILSTERDEAQILMGQVSLARFAKDALLDGGSITVTTGVLAMHPMPGSASVSLVNAGLEGFVRAAALEMPRKLRINAVSPPWVKETMVKFGMDPSPALVSADVAKAYVAAVEGTYQGQILDPRLTS